MTPTGADAANPAGLVSRVLAAAVDALVVVACLAAIRFGLEALGAILIVHLRAVRWLGLAIWTAAQVGLVPAYHVAGWSLAGATPGKWILGLRVIDSDGNAPRLGRALLRFAAYSVSIAPLLAGVAAIAFDPRRRAWHDRLARTAVVHVRAEEATPKVRVRIQSAKLYR